MPTVPQLSVEILPDFSKFGKRLSAGVANANNVIKNELRGSLKANILDSIGENIGQALVNATKRFVGEFATLEKGVREVITLGAGEGTFEAQFERLTQQVRDANVDMGRLSSETVPALYQALSAGIPQDNAFDFLETANIAAKAGVADLDASVSVLSATVNAYGQENMSAAEVSDILFTTVKNGVTTFGELAETMSRVTPTAAAANVSLEEVSGAIQVLTQQGIKTPEAMTQIRATLIELTNPATKVAQVFKELTGQSLKEFNESGGDIVQVFELLTGAAEEAGLATADFFSSVEAKTAVTAFTNDMERLEGAVNAASNSAGASEEAFDIMSGSISGMTKRLDVFRQTIAETMGKNLQHNMRQILELALELAPAVLQIADTFSQGLGQTARFVVIPALRAVEWPLKTLATVLESIPGPIIQITGAWLAMGSTFRYNPFIFYTSLLQRFGSGLDFMAGSTGRFIGVTQRLAKALPLLGAAFVGTQLIIKNYRDRNKEAEEAGVELIDIMRKQGDATVTLSDRLASTVERYQQAIGATNELGEATADLGEGLSNVGLRRELIDRDVLGIFEDLGFSTREVGDTLLALEGIDPFQQVGEFIASTEDLGGDALRRVLMTIAEGFGGADHAAGELALRLVSLSESGALTDEQLNDIVASLGKAEGALDEARGTTEAAAEADLDMLLAKELVTQEMIDQALVIADGEDATLKFSRAVELLEAGLDSQAKALLETERAGRELEEGTEDLGLSYDDLVDAASDVEDAIDAVSTSYRKQFDLAVNVEDATQAFIEAYREAAGEIEALTKAQDEFGNEFVDSTKVEAVGALNIFAEEGSAARDVIQDMVERTLDLAEVREDGDEFLRNSLAAQRELFIQAGVAAENYDAFIEQLSIPETVVDQIDVDAALKIIDEQLAAMEEAGATADQIIDQRSLLMEGLIADVTESGQFDELFARVGDRASWEELLGDNEIIIDDTAANEVLDGMSQRLEGLVGEPWEPVVDIQTETATAELDVFETRLRNADGRIVTTFFRNVFTGHGTRYGTTDGGDDFFYADGGITTSPTFGVISENFDTEVIINTSGSSLQRQYELARDSGLLANLNEHARRQAEATPATARTAGAGASITIQALHYDEVLLADLNRRLLERL